MEILKLIVLIIIGKKKINDNKYLKIMILYFAY